MRNNDERDWGKTDNETKQTKKLQVYSNNNGGRRLEFISLLYEQETKNEEDREYNIILKVTRHYIFQHNKEQITAIYIHNERKKRKI